MINIKELAEQAQKVVGYLDGGYTEIKALDQEKFAELMTTEFIGLLEYEIAMLEKYKTTSCNDFDRRWHEGKIVHFRRMIEKTKEHFGVEDESIRAGADIHAGDGGYEIGTQEAYDEFVKIRNAK